jgi:glucan biosynthesis protein C
MPLVSATDRRMSRLGRGLTAPVGAAEPARPPGAGKPRYHAFDALRGMAMFLVIGLHAALAYIQHDIKGVLWCVRDSPTLPAFDWFCWWSMGVSNPLYFTIAGFFAVMLYDSRGPRVFLANRGRRVAGPFLVGSVTILPACMAAWAFGWMVSGRCTWRELRLIRFHDPAIQAERYGSGHLWFLEYLMVMLLAYAATRHLLGRRGETLAALRRLVARVVGSPWGPFLLAVPTTALLWISRDKVGVDAILDRHNSFLIDPVKFLHHASFFVAGLVLYGLRDELARIARPASWFLALSIPAFIARAWFLGLDQAETLHGPAELALVASGALFSWLMVFGAIGAAHRLFREPSPTLSYLADSSYWIYLIHMPILGLIQGDLYLVPGHALWKAPVVLAVTLAIGFGTYQCLVRHTAIGTALHGRRKRAEAQAA